MTSRRSIALSAPLFLSVALFAACGDDALAPTPDAGTSDAATLADAGADDAAMLVDAGVDAAMIPPPIDSGPMAPDAAASCAITGALPVPGEVTGRLTGEGTNASTTCTPSEGTHGPEHYYTLHLDERRQVTLTATSSAAIVLAIRTACDDPLSEVACEVQGYGYPLGVTTITQTLEPGEYFVLVDVLAEGVGGDYTLTVSTSTPAANGTCATAMHVTPGATLTGQHLELGEPFMLTCPPRVPFTTGGPALWYSVTVPAHSRVVASDWSGPGPGPGPELGLAIAFFSSCGPSECLAGDVPQPTVWDNVTDAPVEVFVVVGSIGVVPGPVTFDLTVSITTLPDHASCSHAEPLTSGTAVSGDAFLADLYYTITVPPGQLLRVSASAGPAFLSAGRVRIVDDCATLTCLHCPGSTTPVFRNLATTSRDVVVVVGADVGVMCTRAMGCDPSFTITPELVPLAGNSTCGGATPLPLDTPSTLDLALGGAALGCESAFSSPDDATLYYTAHVPPGETLHVSALTADTGASVGIVGSCAAAAACVARATGDYGTPAMLAYANSGASAADVVVEVSGGDAVARGATGELVAQIGPPRANTVCASAPAVADGARFVAEDPSRGTDTLTSVCAPLATGRVLYYPVSLPAGQELAVFAQVAGSAAYAARPVIRLMDRCSPTSCLAWRAPSLGGTTQLIHVNETASTENLVVAVGGGSPTATGLFDLSFSIRAPRYVITTTATSCDDMSAATSASATYPDPLPFSFELFGDAVSQFTASVHGYAQLFGATGYGSTASSNAPLPSTDAPPGIVAGLWTALTPGFGLGTRPVVATFGAGPNRHVTIGWSDLQYSADATSRLTFQVKLFEGTNVVELHYCSMTSSDPRVEGGGLATVGMQDLTRTRAAMHSFDEVGAVSTAAALRFTPNP